MHTEVYYKNLLYSIERKYNLFLHCVIAYRVSMNTLSQSILNESIATNFGGGLGFAHEVYLIAESVLDLTKHLLDSY